jgi:hypothetical protein
MEGYIGSRNQYPQKFLSLFDKICHGHGHQSSDVFNRFLDFCLYYLSGGIMTEGLEAVENHHKGKHDAFLELFNILGDGSEGFQDMLGTVYQEISSSYKASKMGQFFTPDAVSDLMAQIAIGDLDVNAVGKSINDPSCGSGMMLLKAAEKFGVNRHNQFFVGQDLDGMCAKMCAINMSLNTIPGRVYQMDTLAMKYYAAYDLRMMMYQNHYMCLVNKWPKEQIDEANQRVQAAYQRSAETKAVEDEQEKAAAQALKEA